MLEIRTKKELLEQINQGAIVLTPNNRLSASLLKTYYDFCGHSTVIKPKCLPYSQALKSLYDQLCFTSADLSPPTLLNDAHCRYLWQQIILETPELTYSEGLLLKVIQAWTTCELWQIQPDNNSFSHSPQTQTFQRWWQVFNKHLKEINALHEYQLVPYLIKTHSPFFKAPIIWHSFDEYTPQQRALQKVIAQQNQPQYTYDLNSAFCAPQLYAAENHQQEYQQLLNWLEMKLLQGEKKIGVVAPELQQQSRVLNRLLLEQFDPSLFNISLGEPLSTYPLVAHALSWLGLEQKLNQQEVLLLLQSPYLSGSQQEFLVRAQLVQEGNYLLQQEYQLANLSKTLLTKAPLLSELLNKTPSYPSFATPHEWVNLFQERLNAFGFPGEYGLSSLQYQCYHRFIALFDEFRQFSLIKSSFNLKDALAVLNQLAQSTIFQAQKKDAPIQISGLLEASGCEFDSLWIMGLTDHCLPAKTNLSAFIPPALQRDCNMPHSTAARELHFANQTLTRLQKGSRSLVFSYSKLQGDSPNLPCPLISQHPIYEPPFKEATTRECALIPLSEEYKISLLSNEQVAGGTALLSNQAKCPFKAFAEHRLFATPLPQIMEGIDHKERGTIIHKVMELIWTQLQNQITLIQQTEEQLEQRVESAILEAKKEFNKKQPMIRPKLVEEIETTRLKRLVLGCLEWEKQRPSFSIHSLEQSFTIHLANLEFKVRVDRLDKVGDKTWVIDYKSTLPTHKPWNEERPQEPQLLLYALLDEHINTLLFMQIKTGSILCHGLSEEKSEIRGISQLKKAEQWSDARTNWYQQLNSIAEEVVNGLCKPQPTNATTCSYCDFKNLCRIS